METHFVGVVLVLAMCCAFHSTRAQSPPTDRPVQVGALIGGDSPTGAFAGGSTRNLGLSIGLAASLPLPPRRLSMRADASYYTFEPFAVDCANFLGARRPCAVNPVAEMFAISGVVVGRLNDPRTPWSPYALAGAAAYANSGSANYEFQKVGLQWGLGFETRPATRTIIFAEWRHMAMGDGGVSSVALGARF